MTPEAAVFQVWLLEGEGKDQGERGLQLPPGSGCCSQDLSTHSFFRTPQP